MTNYTLFKMINNKLVDKIYNVSPWILCPGCTRKIFPPRGIKFIVWNKESTLEKTGSAGLDTNNSF